MTRILFVFIIPLIFYLRAEAQILPQLYSGRQEMFLEAESYFLFDEYNDALPIYLELLREQPGNSFLNYRVGRCFINIPGQKDKAVPFLEKAIDDIDHRERRPTYRTTRAPLDALFYLGSAYHINYRFDDALDMYRLFREKMSQAVYSAEVVDDYIRASLNAIENVGHRVFFIEENLGERINTRYSEIRPAVSGNEKLLVFSRKLPFYDGVFFSEKTSRGEWSWPVEITAQIGCEGDCYPVSLSWDGRELYLYKSDNLVGNIYVSRFGEGEWSAARKLNQNINSRHWESHASVSRGGDTLYFASNRPGGFGGLDIYYSVRNARGDWGPAVNLGPTINTPFNEDAPFISEDGRTLYFNSPGHSSIGGYDIFYSSRSGDGGWTSPLNAGYGINTPDDDLYFVPVKNGKYAYVSKFDRNGFGEMDIFRYEVFSETNPRRFLVTGSMKRSGGQVPGASASIKVIDPVSRNVVYSGKPDLLTGEYGFTAEAGEWEVMFSEKGYEDIIRKIRLSPDRENTELRLSVEMRGVKIEEAGIEVAEIEAAEIEAAEIEAAEPRLTGLSLSGEDAAIPPREAQTQRTLGINRNFYAITGKEKISISLDVEPDTMLEVEKYLDGSLAATESIGMDSDRYNYEYLPVPGNNVLVFRHTGISGDVVTAEVVIEFNPREQEESIEGERVIQENDTVIMPDYFDTPVPDEERTEEPGRAVPFRLVLILAVILLIAFYFKERRNRNRKQ